MMAGRQVRAVGLMSGTSLDGIDAAALITDGVDILARGPSLFVPYPSDLVCELRDILDLAPILAAGDPRVAKAARTLTEAHVAAVRALGWPADILGFHGQTIFHAPQLGRTWQIGDPKLLAQETATPVACDFRLADVAAGGQGAPLVPVYHQALCAKLDLPVLVLNIGGVANITLVTEDGITACDTGPGNALLDDFCARVTGERMDRDGRLALAGSPDQGVLTELLKNPFFAKAPPKSLDRLSFHDALARVETLPPENAAATLAAFTAAAVAATPLPAKPKRVLVCGGGRKNPAIMAALKKYFLVPVDPVEIAGFDGDVLEAECFAYLAVRVLHGLPLSFPGTTGVKAPLPGGRIEIGCREARTLPGPAGG